METWKLKVLAGALILSFQLVAVIQSGKSRVAFKIYFFFLKQNLKICFFLIFIRVAYLRLFTYVKKFLFTHITTIVKIFNFYFFYI